jgi:hypothetical protein
LVANEVPGSGVTASDNKHQRKTKASGMQDATSYRQYAQECRRIAATMGAREKAVLLEMAKVWEERAEEAERSTRSKG